MRAVKGGFVVNACAHVNDDATKHAPTSKLTVHIDHENNAVSFIRVL